MLGRLLVGIVKGLVLGGLLARCGHPHQHFPHRQVAERGRMQQGGKYAAGLAGPELPVAIGTTG